MSKDNDAVLALRKSGGYCLLNELGLIEIVGPDATAFLQARLSNDVKALAPGQGQMTTLLDRKAHVLAYFALHRLGDRFIVVVETKQIPVILDQLETYRFREQVTFKHHADAAVWTAQGPKSELLLSMGLQGAPRPASEELGISAEKLWGKDAVVVRRSLSGEPGVLFILEGGVSAELGAKIAHEAEALGMQVLSPEALDTARIEAGLFLYGTDFSIDNLLPETGLENSAASYSKGCFQGQEVLARIRTFGAPRRGMVGLLFDEGVSDKFALDAPILLAGEEIGQIKSNVFSPTLKREIALAYVAREYRVPDQKLKLTIGGHDFGATIVLLPFYSGEHKKSRAVEQYNKALTEFATGSESTAIEMLRETIELDPMFADAYEALGVILSRQDQLDEAIALMKRLEHLDPDSIMAHTNLSVFYMQQGNKELAEEEKAAAMSIRMSIMAREMAAEQKQKEEAANRKQDAEQRMELFKQVLAIDPDDFLANSGLGAALVDAEQYQDALPYLEKALSIKTNHTVTYVALGQAYERANRADDAIATYKQGIAVASQRGEMTPLKEMQARLGRLT